MKYNETFKKLGLTLDEISAGAYTVLSPIDGTEIGKVSLSSSEEISSIIDQAQKAFLEWQQVPPPKRGELIRIFANVLRENKQELGRLVTIECGKIYQEGMGEVQEMIDICDFAVGLSRQLYGLTIASERPGHRMMETWHPLGVVGVISAFNFPVAVWAWNFALSIVCGNSVIWKPSKQTPLCALACQKLFLKACQQFDGTVPQHLSHVFVADRDAAEHFVDNPLVRLISATGSTRMGKTVAPRVAARLGKSLMELGGNNAMIVAPSADQAMALRAILFSAVGTAGQRCTSLRRLIVHESIYDALVPRLKESYASIAIGNPLEEKTLVGPLINKTSYDNMVKALAQAENEGGCLFGGKRVLVDQDPHAYYVQPAIAEMKTQTPLVCEETFAPILYVMKYNTFKEAITLHNGVAQGLASCIFTNDVREAERFVSDLGSDCGIANVNIGPSGAEIGGAFGGEKDTGGGRESGSDAWKNYMRRATNTINYSRELPLAQGIKFGDE